MYTVRLDLGTRSVVFSRVTGYSTTHIQISCASGNEVYSENSAFFDKEPTLNGRLWDFNLAEDVTVTKL